ncbi:uncharacterized protein LOC114536629 [Dendronephthya gigantea]|uniref:uncharacterized protein LOC114536629 n=1 Tax=Dendronephthya gigantea TaxID=151771 RepID=UPI00106C63BB|nr:uncharacterized protein LOC114536629 [Dendronephthya gigantea]
MTEQRDLMVVNPDKKTLAQHLSTPTHCHGRLYTIAMLDNDSTCSLVLASTADKLSLEGLQERIVLNGIQGQSELISKRVNMQVSRVNKVSPRYDVSSALVVDSLNVPQKSINLTDLKSKWSHLKDVDIVEANGYEVSMLIGSDCLDIILPIETRIGPKGTPVGVCTKLGWTITGPMPEHVRDSETILSIHVPPPDEELHNKVKFWWRTEEFGCKYDIDTQRSIEDEQAMRFLEETTKIVGGRYEVGLLWKDKHSTMQENRHVAEQRLKLLDKRLQRDPDLAEAYKKTIESDMSNGYIRQLSEEEAAARVSKQWYLPHHPVLNPNKPGKVRRVCDAASKLNGSSLNDHLIAGPDLLNSLIGVFMRFREEKIALSADIEAMFNQVAVPEDDHAKCSPTCSNYALLRNAKDNSQLYPETAAAIERTFYMRGEFRLTKWIYNDRDVSIPEPERAASVKAINEYTAMPTERALGVGWDTQRDRFVFKVKRGNPAITRRQVLSLIASLFDPLGFLAPFLVRAKIILQRIWQFGIGWDDCLPQGITTNWKDWERELSMLADFSVSRFYRQIDDKPITIQLHVFGDASELAFCSVVYLRFTYGDGSASVSFVIAKTRVAPKKQLSIPKLELQAAVLCTRLASVRADGSLVQIIYEKKNKHGRRIKGPNQY